MYRGVMRKGVGCKWGEKGCSLGWTMYRGKVKVKRKEGGGVRTNVWKVRRPWNRGRVGDHSSEKRVSFC